MTSVQLWSVRDEIDQRGWDPVLEELAAAGFRHVEPFAVSYTLAALREPLAKHGLTTPTAHGDFTGDQLMPTLEAAAELGAELVMHAGFLAERWQGPDAVQHVADDLNRAAEAAEPLGMRVAFHNHDNELRTLVNGRPALIELMDHVGPRVGVEFDPNWATIAGVDVLATLKELGTRIFALHLKDGPLHGTNEDQCALGDGELDWPAFLGAVPSSARRVIGLDMFAGDSLDAVIRSKRWLDQHGA